MSKRIGQKAFQIYHDYVDPDLPKKALLEGDTLAAFVLSECKDAENYMVASAFMRKAAEQLEHVAYELDKLEEAE